jgi:hypothetical protein
MRGVLKPREERRGGDAYFTPPRLAEASCARLAGLIKIPTKVLEPGAGSGVFVHAARKQWDTAHVVGIDVAPQAHGILRFNFLLPGALPGIDIADLIIGNPPYMLAEQFVDAALARLNFDGHVAFLLRLSFLGGQKRADTLWSRRDLRWLLPITPRPSFTQDGKTDASEYALYVWERGYHGNAEILAPLRWRNESPQRALALTNPEAA